jgi:hypothetical protein
MFLSKSVKYFVYTCLLSLLFSCSDSAVQTKKVEPYTGPISEADDFYLIFTDSARVLYKIASNRVEELQNGDRVFPKGIYVETLDGEESIESILQSDSAYFDKSKQLWILKSNVELHNLKSGEQMFSQELYWDVKASDSTNVYVKEGTYVEIKTPEQVFTGYGLRTSQDFQNYEILNLEGIFSVGEEDEERNKQQTTIENEK